MSVCKPLPATESRPLPHTIHKWEEIEKDFHGTILLGNGASIAVDESFDYPSLKKYAEDENLFTDDVFKVFTALDTHDFELILRILWQATNVNKALGIPDNKTVSGMSFHHIAQELLLNMNIESANRSGLMQPNSDISKVRRPQATLETV